MTSRVAARLALVAIGFLPLASACAARRFTPPSGPGTPFPEYAAAFQEATAHCAGVKTLTVTLGLSGRAGSQRLRGRIDAGFSAPGDIRLEGRAPFGRPVFILVARGRDTATLVLPRDNRVLQGAPPAAIVEALAGVALDPAELRSAVAGCGVASGQPSGATAYGDWVAADVAGGAHYLKRVDGRWRLLASTRGPLTIEYADFGADRPSTVLVRTTFGSGVRSDLRLSLSDVNINVPIEPEAFREEVPPGADPLTIEELRRSGPLGTEGPR